MHRRDFFRYAGVPGAVIAGMGLTQISWAQQPAAKPVAGKDYQVLDTRMPVDASPDKVEVVEFFSYMCPHCNEFQPTFEGWIKQAPKVVAVRRVPVNFLPNAEVLQRLYYSEEAMGLVDKLHNKVFVAIHQEHYNFKDANAAADWVSKQGVDRAKFLDQFNSFSVATKVNRANQLTAGYKVEGVPSLGVAGRFLTSGTSGGLHVVEALAADLHAAR